MKMLGEEQGGYSYPREWIEGEALLSPLHQPQSCHRVVSKRDTTCLSHEPITKITLTGYVSLLPTEPETGIRVVAR